MAGFMMALGGALKGGGEAQQKNVAAMREERLRELAEDRADARNEREMQFRSQEAEIGRSAQVQENIRSEGVAASERQLDRDAAGTSLETDAEGNEVLVNKNKGTVRNLTRPDGTKVKLLTKASDTPADIQFMEYLIKNGAAKNVNDAANRLRDIRGNGTQKASLGLYKDFLKANIEANVDDPEGTAKRQVADAIATFGGDDEGVSDPNQVSNDPVHIEGATPSGRGTEKAPYRADTQNHVDWFKRHAKPGEWMIIDGTPYKK